MFIRKRHGKCCIILVYVDDLIITCDDVESIAELKEILNLYNKGS